MYPWNIAKSAEAMFSRLVVKRLCKFMLKKKLGQLLLGDVDLDQLDVQLGEGTIQLNDLALNVDFLNQKFGAATSVMVKEGSIGSLLVRMPWKGRGLEVEVDEVELVLAPWMENHYQTQGETSSFSHENHDSCDLGKPHHDAAENAEKSTSGNVHEGVKTIAKMVKWLLTSFNIKITNLIIALDPFSEEDRRREVGNTTMVLRVSDIECGTCVSEDGSNTNSRFGSFLGISQLTNTVKFQGAVVELLQMDNIDKQTCFPYASATTGEFLLGSSLSIAAIPILTGKKGGFSGNIKLSVPWKDGSLDNSRVDADVAVDPVQLKLQSGTIKWFLLFWKAHKNLDKDGKGYTHNKSNDSGYFGSASSCPLSVPISAGMPSCGDSPSIFPSTSLESVCEVLLPGSHFISNWVPFSIKQIEREEFDLGASMDQFFECFDEMRSSQSALGSSGMWKCSVFSAITAASSLASGSLHIPPEKQHFETNLNAHFAGISVSLSFPDVKQKKISDPEHDQINSGSYDHFLGAECGDFLLVMQVCPQEMRFHGTIKYIELADYLSCKNNATFFGLHDNNISSQTLMVRQMQADVQDALPPFSFSTKDHDPNEVNGVAETVALGNITDVTKITLLETSGVTSCQFKLISSSPDGSSTGSKSFSLRLSPLVFWVNFPLMCVLLDLFKEIQKSITNDNKRNIVSPEVFDENHVSSYEDVKRGSNHRVTTLSSTGSLQGDIVISSARIILCFPFESGTDIRGYSSWDQFIVLDFLAPSVISKGATQEGNLTSDAISPKKYSAARDVLHLNIGSLVVFLVTLPSKDASEINSCHMKKQKSSAQNILSITNNTVCVITMFWQEGQVTGPWMAKKAKSLALKESSSRHNSEGKGYEYASVSTVKDLEDSNFQTRQEMILSSTFVLHACLSFVRINLDSSQYKEFHCLLNQLIKGLSSVTCNADDVGNGFSASQTSVLVDCDCLEISIKPDTKENVNCSIQSELPGSWCRLRLKVRKFELLSVSNIGGISDSNFLRLAHGEGKLLGSTTGVPDKEFLLISCSNSTMKRGDGEGSNALSCRLAGSEVMYLWDPTSFHGCTSITVRCGTIVAVGGRLDWLEALASFFRVSPEVGQAGGKSMEREEPNECSRDSFVLNLVDVGLSYEPYLKNLVARSELLGSKFGCSSDQQGLGEDCVACLVAASSLTISNSTVADTVEDDYRIILQDFGLLLRLASNPENLGGSYSVEDLRKFGYVKIAHETLVEAMLRTNCKSSLLWELEFSKSHVFMETCHDTTAGLFQLAAQLQQLFAPDLEDAAVHLQSRWNNVQLEHERKYFNDEPSSPQGFTSNVYKQGEAVLVGLMDEIYEDAFISDDSQTCEYDSSKSHITTSLDGSLPVDISILNREAHEVISPDTPFYVSMPVTGLESNRTLLTREGCYTEYIDGYCLSEPHPPADYSLGGQFSLEIPKSKDMGSGNFGASNGWYEDMSLRIVENHISKPSSVKESVEDNHSSNDSKRPDNLGNANGRVLLKNIDVRWKMYAGSDWKRSRENGEHTINTCKRDTSVCLELTLSGMQVQYDVFPAGGTCISKLSLSVQDFHLCDSSIDAPWKLVLGYYNSKNHPRESSSKAFKLDLEAIRPDPSIPLEEYLLRISILPILVHLHQHQLDFIISFFGGKSLSVNQSSGSLQDSDGSETFPTRSTSPAWDFVAEEALLPYFQKFDIQPMLVRVDYSPSRVDLAALRDGKYVELVNLVPWKGVELQLKDVHASGIYGWGNVCETVIGEWLEDISQNQIHRILGGLPTIRSLVAVGTGASKLVSLPVESYRKERKMVKGMQRGTVAFLRSISLEAVGLGVHLAAGAHDILLQAENILTSIPPSIKVQRKTKRSARSNQPKDAQEGIRKAFESLSDGLGKSASALVRNPLKKYQRGAGAGSALATAVRAFPAAAIAPASGCASAIHYTLLGFRNSLDPERKKESMEKYLGPTDSREHD